MTIVEGLLPVDKPAGPTSHDVVAAVRRRAGLRRVGHSGTLDPPATGLLLVALGRATRLLRFLPQEPKRYAGVLELGRTTDTDDATGEETGKHGGPPPPAAEVLREAAALVGTSLQKPPSVSARKVGGRRMYRLARLGVEVDAPARPVRVERFELQPLDATRYAFEVSVSSGTYIRALARDLGLLLGCGGLVESLRRTAIGPVEVDDALTLLPGDEDGAGPALPDGWDGAVVPIDRLPLTPPRYPLVDADDVRRFAAGVALPLDPGTDEGFVTIRDGDGRLLGIADARDDRLHPTVVLPPAAA